MKFFAFCFGAVTALLFPALVKAQEPAANPTNLQFTTVKTYNAIMSFTGVTCDGYLVLKSTQPITVAPVDGVAYDKGEGLGNAKVMVTGNATLYNVRGLLERTKYYFAIYAYNGGGSSINYRQTAPLIDSLTTPASDPGTYYSAVDSSSYSFITDLHNLINPHTMSSYTPGYASTILPAMYERDTVGGQAVVNCEYSEVTTIYTPPFSFTGTNYNREHVLCKSWMQTYTQFGSNVVQYPEGADYFNLLLTAAAPNNARSNRPYGVVVTQTGSYGPSKLGKDANNINVFEPGDNRKGDAARAMMYEMICYNGTSGDWGLDYLLAEAGDQSQAVLKQWNQQDPPDRFERTKNDYIYSVQNNRNPFIDHPEWAKCINFDSLFKTSLCGAISGVKEVALDANINTYPNPAGGVLNIAIANAGADFAALTLIDMMANEILTGSWTGQNATMDVSALPQGNYVLRITIGSNSAYKKVLVLN